MVRANSVTPVRGIRQAMAQEKDSHVFDASTRRRMTAAGTPPAITSGGIGRVTTAPAPTTLLAPTSAITTAALPIQAPAPIRTRRGVPGCSRIGLDGSLVP